MSSPVYAGWPLNDNCHTRQSLIYACSRLEREELWQSTCSGMAKSETLKSMEVISINGLPVTHMSVYNVYTDIGSEYIKRLITYIIVSEQLVTIIDSR